MIRALTPLARLLLAVAFFVVMLLIFLAWQSSKNRDEATTADAGRVVAEGQAAAGRDAVGTVAANAKADNATDQQTRTSRNVILSAPGAATDVDPGVDAAGRRAICLRKSALGLPSCELLLDAYPR